MAEWANQKWRYTTPPYRWDQVTPASPPPSPPLWLGLSGYYIYGSFLGTYSHIKINLLSLNYVVKYRPLILQKLSWVNLRKNINTCPFSKLEHLSCCHAILIKSRKKPKKLSCNNIKKYEDEKYSRNAVLTKFLKK